MRLQPLVGGHRPDCIAQGSDAIGRNLLESEFLDKQEAAGDPIVGPSKATSINVNGKSVDVNEYTTQSGKKLYLDGSGNEVKPETSMT